MKKGFIALCALAILTGAWYVDFSPVYQPNVLEARQKSEEKHIPYVMFFGAEWCSPCQWMEKFTYSDSEFKNYLKDHYSAVKLDIDAFEGYALKEQYQVKTLPTMIIFDHEHRLLARYENTYEPQDVIEILKWHKSGKIGKAPVQTQSTGQVVQQSKQSSGQETTTSTRRVVTTTQPSTSTSTTRTTSNGTPLTRPVQQNTTSRPVATTNHNAHKDFTIQVGAFSTRANAERMRNTVSAKAGGQDVSVRKVDHPKYTYRVIVGRFADAQEASSTLFALDSKGHKGLLKRISAM